MSIGQFRTLIATVALLLLAFSAWLAVEATWAVAGLGAFVDQWGARFPALIDESRWAEQFPQTGPPDDNWLSNEVTGYVGHRLDRIMLAPLVTLIAAMTLGCIAMIRPRAPKATVQAS